MYHFLSINMLLDRQGNRLLHFFNCLKLVNYVSDRLKTETSSCGKVTPLIILRIFQQQNIFTTFIHF